MTEAYVVDASVVLRWYLDQVGYEHARRVRDAFVVGAVRLEAPEILRWEVGNQLRKKGVATGRLAEEDALRALTDLDDLGAVVHDFGLDDLLVVTRLSIREGISMFDAAYVLLALRTGLTLLTAGARLVNAVSSLISTELLRGIGSPTLDP